MSDPSPFTRAAADLIELGYHVIPIMPADKAPGYYRSGRAVGMRDWQRFRDRPPSKFDLQVWNTGPDLNGGVVFGSRHRGLFLIGVDVDAPDPDDVDTILSAIPQSPMAKRGRKGETRFYLAPAEIRSRPYNRTSDRVRLVDLLTGFETRQTVVPPSVHPETGQPYRWLAGPVPAENLPVFGPDELERLEDTLRHLGWDPEAPGPSATQSRPRPARSTDSGDDIWREANDAALIRLDAWVPALDLYGLKPARSGYEAVNTWRPSSTGRPLHERKRNLSLQPDGIKDWGTNETFTAIDVAMRARGLDMADATDWLRECLGLKDTSPPIVLALTPKAEPQPIAVLTVLEPPAPEPRQESEIPDELTRPPGLLGELTDWICDTARRPNRPLALGAALTIVGTAAGRRYGGPTRSGTHLYVLGIAGTSTGKDHPLTMIPSALSSAELTHAVGGSQFMSLSAIVNRITSQPLTLCAMDEFGSFLSKMKNKRGSTHEQAMPAVLRELWGRSFKPYNTPEWAGRASTQVNSPSLSLYAVTTPEQFYDAVGGEDIANGFLNRFLLLSTRAKARDRDPERDPWDVPESITAPMKLIAGTYREAANALYNATTQNVRPNAPLITAEWADDRARGAHRDFLDAMERREDGEGAAFYGRTVEIALRLATIRAIGLNYSQPRVTAGDFAWARDVAMWSADRMAAEVSDYMAENETQANAKKLLWIVRTQGRIKHSELVRQMQHTVRARDLKDLLGSLADAGQIVAEAERPAGGGVETRWYRAA